MAATLEQLYDFITGEDSDEARACAAISEEACTNVPANFFLNAANGAVTKLGDQLHARGGEQGPGENRGAGGDLGGGGPDLRGGLPCLRPRKPLRRSRWPASAESAPDQAG